MGAVAVSLSQERPLPSLEEILLYAISNNLALLQGLTDPTHDRELDEQIAMGWGSTPQTETPPDWKTRRGPERPHTPERREAISQGMRRPRETRSGNRSSNNVSVMTVDRERLAAP